MQVRELMVRNPWGIQANDSVRHAAELMRRHGVGSLIVYEQERPAGMLTDRDIPWAASAADTTMATVSPGST